MGIDYLSVVLVYILVQTYVKGQCSNYKTLSNIDRSRYRSKSYNGKYKCDKDDIKANWYRFVGSAGLQIATTCVPSFHCATAFPGWMQGSHPTLSQGNVTRKVCFTRDPNCCAFSTMIGVKNCGSFYVYYLPPVEYCPLRYCGEVPGTVRCSFDLRSFCLWNNVQSAGNSWVLKNGRSSLAETGPSHDVSGIGYYAYIDSSGDTIYDAKAVLISPVFTDPKQITFYYHMYGATVESLAVIVNTTTGKRDILWRLSGSQGNAWQIGCVNINYTDKYQVSFKATAGGSDSADIAIDNIEVFDKLTQHCNIVITHSDQSYNCSFNGTLCGWRNIVNKFYMDGLLWKLGNAFIYVSSPSLQHQGQTKAYLISPRLDSPYCMQFNYSIANDQSSLDVVILSKIPASVFKIWSSNKTTKFKMTQITLPHSGIYQLTIVATPEGETAIVLSGVSLVPGFCDGHENSPQKYGDCNFEPNTLQSGLCLWHNEYNTDFEWTIRSKYTSSRNTGPTTQIIQQCKPQDKSNSSKEGDVRLVGTSVRGELQIYHNNTWGAVCYQPWHSLATNVVCQQLGHRRGGRVYYIYSATPHLKWISNVTCKGNESRLADCNFDGWGINQCQSSRKAGIECYLGTLSDRPCTIVSGTFIYLEASAPRIAGDKARITSPWMSGNLCMTFDYHMYGSAMSCVIIYVRQKGSSVLKPLWVKSGNRGNKWYKGMVSIGINNYYQVVVEGIRGTSFYGDATIDDITFSKGFCTSNETRSFSLIIKGDDVMFDWKQPTIESNGWSNLLSFQINTTAGFGPQVYTYSSLHMFPTKLDTRDAKRFPQDSFPLQQNASKKIYFASPFGNSKIEVQTNRYTAKKCCNEVTFSFGVTDITKRETSMCGNEWYQVKSSCIRFVVLSLYWRGARRECLKLGGSLATFDSKLLTSTSQIFKKFNFNKIIHTGFRRSFEWIWTDDAQTLEPSNLWGPNEPSGDGICGALLDVSAWKGYYWNDLPCDYFAAYICQDIRRPKSPIAFYPLNGNSSSREASPDSLPRGTPSNVILDDGPRGDPNGSYYFNGSHSSYILLPLNTRLDIMTSLTILVWVYPEAHGVVVSYGTGLEIYVTKQTTIAATIPFKWQTKPYAIESKGIRLSSWVHIAVWYDYYKGLIGLRVGNQTVVSPILLPRKAISADSDIKLGASLHGNQAFKGKVTSVQIYDDVLSEKEIEQFKDIQPESLRCRSGFVAVRGNCFFIGNIKVKGVDQAGQACGKMNATLAKIHSEYIRIGIEAILNNIKPKLRSYHIGFKGNHKWIDGSDEVLPWNSSLWITSSPDIDIFKRGFPYLALDTNNLKISRVKTWYRAKGAICKKHEINVAYKCNTSASSDAPHSSPSYAVDGDRNTCYSSQMENKTFLQIELPNEIFLHKVIVAKNKDCCKQPYTTIKVMATDDNNTTRACGAAAHYGVNDVMEFYCSPTVRARFVKVTTSDDRNVSLVLCEVELFKIERGNMHGVQRQIWFNAAKTAARIKDDVMFTKRPDSEDTIDSLILPVNFGDYYAQHLMTFLQIPITANYKFTVTCDNDCDLLVGYVSEEGIGYTPTKEKQILAYVLKWTGRYQWDKYPSQTSSPISLHQCLVYRLDAYMIEYKGGDHLLARMELANGGPRETPINKNRLYRTLTGKRVFNIQLGHNNTHHALVGPNLSFRVSMRYCCEGIYCINCPLKVYLVFVNQEYSISQSLAMNCKYTNVTVTINKVIQPGNYSVEAAFDFVNQSALNGKRSFGHIIIKVNQIHGCTFTKGICGWLHGNGGDPSWKVLNKRISTKDHSVVINGHYSASLQSEEIKLKSFYVQSGLCLQFLYLLPLNKSMASLQVYQVTNSVKTLLWNLTDYHGNTWVESRIPLKTSQPFKVEFYGEGDVDGTVNVAITDIKVSTMKCTLTPSYAKPGFQCKDHEFQCKNKQCVDKHFKCNGDKNCIDGSDEESCCPTNKFLCPSGQCISTNLLCDGQTDCKDSADEDHCDSGCEDFQCISGTCITWSSTCTDTVTCPVQSSNPKICRNNHCPLNNIGCSSNETDTNKDESVCRTFIGPCPFDNGDLCGLMHDQDADFLWTFKSDETQTPSTGPQTDHTQMSDKGTYIYTEASSRRPGDKARLVSGWLNSKKPLCLQFWYHMYGNHIGSLRILVHTNNSEQAVWEMHGNQGNMWRFGQTALNSTSKYKFVLEGETTGGIEGDIAIDDVTLYDGSCQTIVSQQTSPSCDFEHDSCGWISSSQWNRASPTNQFSKSMVYDGGRPSSLVSPLINQNESEWGCFMFWYLHHTDRPTFQINSLNVSMESLEENKLLMFIEQLVKDKWQFVQVPLPKGKKFKISISATLAVSIDEISFTKDTCQPIPWEDTSNGVVLCPQKCGHALGLEYGIIPDSQIAASSYYNSNHRAANGRLNFVPASGRTGAWSARSNDQKQWFQVDFLKDVKFKMVATQGRFEVDQWVTKYTLSYNRDGIFWSEHPKEFQGNTDRSTVVTHAIIPPIYARLVRIHPKAWHGHISMRAEFYGCTSGVVQKCGHALGLEYGIIPDSQIAASSDYNSNHRAANGRLNFVPASGRTGAWSARSNDQKQWFQVDFLKDVKFKMVATQGRFEVDQWVTKYTLSYSRDGIFWSEHPKEFQGNTDRSTVVTHAIIPPIYARLVRIHPKAWHGHISMRAEFYGCTSDIICKNTSNKWSSWKVNGTQNNMNNTWLMTSQPVLYSFYREHNITKRTGDDVMSHEFEIILKSNISLTLLGANSLSQLTMCWWLKTSNQGFRVLYSNDFEKDTNNGGINISISDLIMAEIMNTALATKVNSLFNNKWHFYCFTWSGSTIKQKMSFYLDGVLISMSSLAMQSTSQLAGGGKISLSIPKNASPQNNWGYLSSFNVWSTFLTPKEIKMLSLGCGEEQGNAILWSSILDEADPERTNRQLSTCEDAKGDRMVLKGNTTSFLISRVNYRSYTSSQVCFIFRYMMYGADVDSLTMFVRHDNQSDLIPIWVDKDSDSNEWRYGQVQVTAMATFQIYFRGRVKGRLGFIAVGTTYFNEGDCTKYQSMRKFRVFNKNITTPGYITSPFYPGYYIRDIEYRWYIKVPKNHVLRLTFLDFSLESDITCSQDYVQVYDGKESTSASLGRFCGFIYPQFIMTTTNEMIVIFHSNINGAVRRGFKARLQFIQDQSKLNGNKCNRRKGCPSSCECIIVQNKNSKHKEKMLIQGKLHSVPENMPTSTFALMFGNGYVDEMKAYSFNDLPSLLYVDFAHNKVISIDDDAFVNATTLETLRLNSNFITFARNPPKKPFRHLRELITLDLGNNLLTTLPEDVFFGLSNLKVLGLRSNGIIKIPPRLFYNTRNLTHLYLQDNLITTLPDYGFKSLSNLQLLNLGSNRITELRKETFDGLTSLKHLNLSNNKLTHVSMDAFEDLDNLEYLELDRFILCCYAKKAIGGLEECKSPSNGFSSCDDLMKNHVLRVCIWILGLSALIGNAFVIVWRVGQKNKYGQVHSMLLTNLAVADFLMGVYLITIASMDMKWKGEYFKHDIEWRSGIGCRLTGMISMFSSEVSVAMLAVVTCDRLICIVFPFSSLKITRRKGIFICVVTWIVFLAASIIPIFGLNYFSTDDDDFGFYGRSSVCLPMQLSADRPAGWEYSVVIFVVFNFLSFSFMLGAYIAIYVTVKKSAVSIRSTSDTVKRESALARKAIIIITTDFLCWIPVIIISLLSLTGAFEDPSKQVYAWIAVFVLPLNSSINPFLYTFSSIQLKKEMAIKKKRLRRLIRKACYGSEPLQRNFSCDSFDDVTAVSEVMTMSNKPGLRSRPSSVHQNGPHLTLIDICKILKVSKGIGYVFAMVKSELCMIKYFRQNMKDTWDKEVGTVTALKDFSDKRVLCAYKWHSQGSLHTIDDSKIKISNLDKSLLICYSYVSRTSLQDYMDSEHPMTFSVVCALAIDVITALGYLHEKKICHNNINTRTILVTVNDDPIRAVLADFSNSCKVCGTNNSYLSDIRQFGQLLKMLAIQCEDFIEYKKINDLMYTSIQEGKENIATVIKENLMNLKNEHEGIWDTSL